MSSIRNAAAMLLLLLPTRALAQVPQDAAPDSAVLTLAAVEQGVLARNPSLAAAEQGAEAARARAAGTGAWSDPELSFMVAPGTLGDSDAGYRVGLRQRLSPFGERSAQRLEAGARSDAARADVGTARLDLLREARLAFAEYRRASRSQVAHRAMVDLAAELRQVALAKYAAGAVEQQDPLAAGVEAARLAHHAVLLESERRIAAARLNTLLGRPAAAPLPPPAEPESDPAMIPADLDSLVRQARSARPEAQAAISRVASRVAQRRAVQRSRWPGLMLGVAYDRMWDRPSMRTQVELGIELPLFGGRGAQRLAAEADLSAAQSEHRALVLRIEREVVEAVTRYDEAEHDLAVLDSGVLPAASQSVTALRSSYEANRASFLALLDATRSLAEARLDRIDAVARRDVARADLARALGGDEGLMPMGDMR
jgi:cobalt-zinc-cadmium efflux system outer membrane protein